MSTTMTEKPHDGECEPSVGDVTATSLGKGYALRPISGVLLGAAMVCCAAAFLSAAYLLMPYVPGPIQEGLWWQFNSVCVLLSGAFGLPALWCVRADQLVDGDVGGRLRAWRQLAFAATAGTVFSFAALNVLLGPGAPLWYAYSATAIACVLGLVALGACYHAPLRHWWELSYSMGLLLLIVGAFAFWFPAIDGFFALSLFGVVIWKWARGLLRRGRPRFRIEGHPVRWLLGLGEGHLRRPSRQHDTLVGVTLLLAVAPLAAMGALRPLFQPWDEKALDVFAYVMWTATLAVYTTPILSAAALLLWCRKYQSLSPLERENHVVRREHLALVFFGLASVISTGVYYTGQLLNRQAMLLVLAVAFPGIVLALGSRRRLLLFGILLPIVVGVSLRKLNYVGDFLLPLYVGHLGF